MNKRAFYEKRAANAQERTALWHRLGSSAPSAGDRVSYQNKAAYSAFCAREALDVVLKMRRART